MHEEGRDDYMILSLILTITSQCVNVVLNLIHSNKIKRKKKTGMFTGNIY